MSSSPVHWNRWLPSILAWPQSRQALLAAPPSQWRYTFKKSCLVVRRMRGQVSFLLSRLGSLLGFLVGSFIAGDLNMTWEGRSPAISDELRNFSSALNCVKSDTFIQSVSVLLLKAKIAAWESMKETTFAEAKPAANKCVLAS
ncbi:hypothetical protein TNCV_3436851 [Trichonephila clavipes]|nr:hypothetical protein TNCV_3436851 [Trichonephila clavipes]